MKRKQQNTYKTYQCGRNKDPNLVEFNEMRTTTKGKKIKEKKINVEMGNKERVRDFFTRFNESSRLGIVNSYFYAIS